MPNFCYRGNRGWSEVNFSYSVKFSDHDFPKIVGYFGIQKSFCVIFDEFITYVDCCGTRRSSQLNLNGQSISGSLKKYWIGLSWVQSFVKIAYA